MEDKISDYIKKETTENKEEISNKKEIANDNKRIDELRKQPNKE